MGVSVDQARQQGEIAEVYGAGARRHVRGPDASDLVSGYDDNCRRDQLTPGHIYHPGGAHYYRLLLRGGRTRQQQ